MNVSWAADHRIIDGESNHSEPSFRPPAFPCASASVPSKTDAFGCGAAATIPNPRLDPPPPPRSAPAALRVLPSPSPAAAFEIGRLLIPCVELHHPVLAALSIIRLRPVGATMARFSNSWKGYLEAPETMLAVLR